MALIGDLPTEAYETRVTWELDFPQQRVLRSPGSTQILNLGVGRWTGVIDIGIMRNDADGRKVAAFIDELNGSANEFNVLTRADPALTRRDGSEFTRALSTVGGVAASVRGRISTGVGTDIEGFAPGDMIRISGRVYRVTTFTQGHPGGSSITALPAAFPPTGDHEIEWKGVKMTVRLSDGPVANFATPDFLGPWTLRVEEAPE